MEFKEEQKGLVFLAYSHENKWWPTPKKIEVEVFEKEIVEIMPEKVVPKT